MPAPAGDGFLTAADLNRDLKPDIAVLGRSEVPSLHRKLGPIEGIRVVAGLCSFPSLGDEIFDVAVVEIDRAMHEIDELRTPWRNFEADCARRAGRFEPQLQVS